MADDRVDHLTTSMDQMSVSSDPVKEQVSISDDAMDRLDWNDNDVESYRWAARTVFHRTLMEKFARMLPKPNDSFDWTIHCAITSHNYAEGLIALTGEVKYRRVDACSDWSKPQGAMVLFKSGLLSYDCAELVDAHCGFPSVDFHAVYKYIGVTGRNPVDGHIYTFGVKMEPCCLVTRRTWLIGQELHRDFRKPAIDDYYSNCQYWYSRGLEHRTRNMPAVIQSNMGSIAYYHRGRLIIHASIDDNGRILQYRRTKYSECSMRMTRPPESVLVQFNLGYRPTIKEFRSIVADYMVCEHCRPDLFKEMTHSMTEQ